MRPIYVIAGNFREFSAWCLENKVSANSPLVKYIGEGDGKKILSGIRNPEIISFGTYNLRKDYRELENLVREKTRVEVVQERTRVEVVYREPPKKPVEKKKFVEFVGECFRKVSWRT